MFATTPNVTWKIENFSTVYKKLSPGFRFMGLKFHLRFCQFVDFDGTRIQLFLECQNNSQALPTGHLIVDTGLCFNDYQYFAKKTICNLQHREWCIWAELISIIFKKFGQVKQITFSIMITPNGDLKTAFNTGEETKYMSPCAVSLRNDIGKLFNNEEHSDFTLKCGESKFYAHKAVLAARSDYFAAMFRNDMKETSEGNCDIENIEPGTLELVLRYLYTGEIPEISMDALRKVIFAAEMLLLEPLASKCHSLFIENFTNESKENLEKETKNEQPGLDKQSETVKEELFDAEERQILKNLFISREWRLFEQKFPRRVREMLKPFLEKL